MNCSCCGIEYSLRQLDPWGGRMDAYCTRCAEIRCDAYPGACTQPEPKDDAIDYGIAFGLLIEALLPYWQQQESMPPEQALRKLLNERDLYHAVLSDMADGVEDDYSAWAARVIGVATPSEDNR